MELNKFIDNMVDAGFAWQKDVSSVSTGEMGVALKKTEDYKVHVPYETIQKHIWEDLIKQVKAFNVYHVTRVVGYYSKISNWNKSKLGELADRHKGQYT